MTDCHPPEPEPGNLASATWTEIPGSEMLSIYDPAIDDIPGGAADDFGRVQSAWSGGVGVGDELVVWGGGHSDGANNGLFAVNVLGVPNADGKLWRRLTLPTRSLNPDDSRSNTNPDGSPVARHTYALLASDGSKLYSVGGSVWHGGTAGDPPRSWMFDFAAGTWSNFPESPKATSTGSLAYAGGKLYHLTRHGGATFDIATQTWQANFSGGAKVATVMTYAPDSDRFYILGNGLAGYRQRSAWKQFQPLPPTPLAFEKYLGVAYYPPEKRLVVWKGGPTLHTYSEESGVWEDITPAGDPGQKATVGTFHRINYCAGRLVLVNGVQNPLYYLSLSSQ